MSEENKLFEEELKQYEVEEPVTEEVAETTPETEDVVEEVSTENEIPAEQPSSPSEVKSVPYYERYYLKYRDGKRNTALDLGGTKSFLQEIGFDGGELKQAREGKNCAESLRNTDKSKNNQMYCSYCGAELSGVEFFRLPDGRMRCNTCSNTVVKSKAEVEALCKRVIENIDSFFGATIGVPVYIEVIDERKLKKKLGIPLDTRDLQSMLILGVAVNRKIRVINRFPVFCSVSGCKTDIFILLLFICLAVRIRISFKCIKMNLHSTSPVFFHEN